MTAKDIHLTDWRRIFIGEVPGSFYIELLLRGFVIYVILLVAMRLMGKRMSSQLSRNELGAMVALAAAIGVPLQAPDRGLLPGIIVAVVVVFVERWISLKVFNNQNFEKYAQGNISTLIKNSVMDLEVMKSVRLTRERLNAQLRASGIKQLGEVKRFYMEANGAFTLMKNENPGPGLCIIPDWDKDFYERQKKATDIFSCKNCGNLLPKGGNLKSSCTHCKQMQWIPAAINE